MSPKREDRKEQLSIGLAACGAFGTLILSQFPAPLNYVLIAGANYLLCYHGQKMAVKTRHLYIGSLLNKTGQNKNVFQQNAMLGGAIAGGLSVLPFGSGTFLSVLASGCMGYIIPEVISWV